MSERSEDNSEPKNKRRVLEGYRKAGKRFIPPFLQHFSPTESKWMDDRVPELVWIALLLQVFGIQKGTAIAASIAKAAAKCDQVRPRSFAAASDYTELNDRQKQCILSTLHTEGTLRQAHCGLAALIDNYTGFPLAFLGNSRNTDEDSQSSTINDLKYTIENISDRESPQGVFAQATVVYIYFINNKLKVQAGLSLANFPAIEDYPVTEESRRVAAAVRSAVTGMLAPSGSTGWRDSFWNQGRALVPCEVD